MKAKRLVKAAAAALLLCLLLGLPASADIPVELDQYEPHFVQLGEAGFDDPQNNYAWCMAEFKDDLYVGTGRNVPYTVFLQLKAAGMIPWDLTVSEITHPGGMAPPPFGPDPDPNIPGNQYTPDPSEVEHWAEDMSAEIWRYHDGSWEKVHTAQTFVNPYNGYTYPEGVGYRYMITYTDLYGEEALYTGVGLGFGSTLLLKSTDGETWKPVVFGGAIPPYDTRAMAVHDGRLYVGLGNGGIYATDDPSVDTDTWKKVADFGDNVAIGAIESYNGCLYATTWESIYNGGEGFEVWRSTTTNPGPGDWVRIVCGGAGDTWNPFGADIETFGGDVYVGSMGLPFTSADGSAGLRSPKGFDLIRINDHGRWDLVIGSYVIPEDRQTATTEMRGMPMSGWPSGFGNPLNLYCWQLEEHDCLFYLTTFDASSLLRVLDPELLGSIGFLDLLEPSLNEIDVARMMPAGDMGTLFRMIREDNPFALVHALSAFLGGSDMWVSSDGVHWYPADLNGFGDANNYGFRTLVSSDAGLYVGTANPFEGCQVYVGEVRAQ